jgi:hypothetical protein
MSRFSVVLVSGTRGEIARHQALTRLTALEVARTLLDDAIAKERQSDWWPIETITIKVEFDGG